MCHIYVIFYVEKMIVKTIFYDLITFLEDVLIWQSLPNLYIICMPTVNYLNYNA